MLDISADNVGSEETSYVAYSAIETDRQFSAEINDYLYLVGDTTVFTGTLQGPAGGINGANIQVELGLSNGITETLSMSDLGNGVYRTSWMIADVPGYVLSTFKASGDDGGMVDTRQTNKLFVIASNDVELFGSYFDNAEDMDGDGFNDTLSLEIDILATRASIITLSADLVVLEKIVAHATEYKALSEFTNTILLDFNGRDIRSVGLNGPYTVTNVYLTDIGRGGILAQISYDVRETSAYYWHEFGFDNLYLPLVIR